MKTNNIKTKIIGTVLAGICTISAIFAISAVSASAMSNSSAKTASSTTAMSTVRTNSADGSTEPTVDKEPGIYPIDGDHFLIVYKDHTFRLIHGEPPTTRPWTIA